MVGIVGIAEKDGPLDPKGPTIEVQPNLKKAIRDQLIAVIDGGGEFTSQHLRRLARLCLSMADAMASLERPEKLLRNRFGAYLTPNVGGYDLQYGDSDEAIASAPNIETYGANAQRELVATISNIAKQLAPKPAKMNVVDLMTSINLARATKQKDVEKKLRKKLDELLADEQTPDEAPPLPAPAKGSKKVAATVVAQGGA